MFTVNFNQNFKCHAVLLRKIINIVYQFVTFMGFGGFKMPLTFDLAISTAHLN